MTHKSTLNMLGKAVLKQANIQWSYRNRRPISILFWRFLYYDVRLPRVLFFKSMRVSIQAHHQTSMFA